MRLLLGLAALLVAVLGLLVLLVRHLDDPAVKRRLQALVHTAAGYEIDYGRTHLQVWSGLRITDLVVLSRLFSYVYMRLEAAYDTLMARWHLTAWSWFTLMVVYSRQGEEVTPSDISRVLFLARANVTRLTDDVPRGVCTRQDCAVASWSSSHFFSSSPPA